MRRRRWIVYEGFAPISGLVIINRYRFRKEAEAVQNDILNSGGIAYATYVQPAHAKAYRTACERPIDRAFRYKFGLPAPALVATCEP